MRMYKSPIELITSNIMTEIRKSQDNQIYQAVLKAGVNVDKERYFIGVCDGHGQKGHVVSKYVVNYIENNSSILFKEQTDIINEIKSLMKNTQQSLIQNKTNIIVHY